MNGREDRAVRGRRLSRHQVAVLDRLLSVVANEDAALLVWTSTLPTPPAGGR